MVDKLFEFGLGLEPGIWKFSDHEAEVIARIMLKRADAGNKKVIEAIASIVDKVDYIEAALIILPRAAVTIKEVAQNGVRPKFLPPKSGKNPGKQADKPDGTQIPTQ